MLDGRGRSPGHFRPDHESGGRQCPHGIAPRVRLDRLPHDGGGTLGRSGRVTPTQKVTPRRIRQIRLGTLVTWADGTRTIYVHRQAWHASTMNGADSGPDSCPPLALRPCPWPQLPVVAKQSVVGTIDGTFQVATAWDRRLSVRGPRPGIPRPLPCGSPTGLLGPLLAACCLGTCPSPSAGPLAAYPGAAWSRSCRGDAVLSMAAGRVRCGAEFGGRLPTTRHS